MSHKVRRYTTSDELFGRVVAILDAASSDKSSAYRMMHEALLLVCQEGTAGSGQSFGNLFSQVDYLCRKLSVQRADAAAIQRMRRNTNHPSEAAIVGDDCRALSVLISAVFGDAIPAYLTPRLPRVYSHVKAVAAIDYRKLRCVVASIDGYTMTAKADTDGDDIVLKVDFSNELQQYLAKILACGTQINLIGVRKGEGGLHTADYIIVEPDYLLDISTIARCFTNYGHSPLSYLLGRMTPVANSQAILLGNFAGALLDDAVCGNVGCDWKATLWHNVREKALEYASCRDLNAKEQFAVAAARQAGNIVQAANQLFGEEGQFDRDKAMLEPSFVCEALGIQGRVDLMTTDFRLLVEQKSGANWNIQRQTPNSYGSFQKEDHYVQVLLYYGVLRHNFNLPADKTDIRLLYSKYPLPGGLVVVSFYKRLFAEALKFRNRAVALDFMVARQGFQTVMPLLKTANLNEKGVEDKLWTNYVRPQLESVILPVASLDGADREYFCRMMTFVFREQLYNKTGTLGQGNSMADLWNMSLEEKVETGNIFCGLTLDDMERSDESRGYDKLTLTVPDSSDTFIPNFRQGDMVYLYAYRGKPDVRHAILFKGTLAEMRIGSIVVCLSNGQHNADNFRVCPPSPDNSGADVGSPLRYAVEHCGSDSSATAAVRSLHKFASTVQADRDLLMGRREPRRNAERCLTKSYNPSYDDIVLKAKQADDYFLLVGPPGTGKTSMALRFLVAEELASPCATLLLTAYTNRAVDEICGMLADNGYDFLRIGNEYTCDARFRNRLLSKRFLGRENLEDIRHAISEARIIVGTTSTLASRSYLFDIKTFSLVIVDEASQILEPDIIGLLCSARRPCGDTTQQPLSKFILIGDYKQLPAVVRQDASESAVESGLLAEAGLRDCRESLFERLIRNEHRQQRSHFVGTLNKYGRMHPDIAQFPNNCFYRNEHLMPVPLPHQTEPSPLPRVVFISSADESPQGLSEATSSEKVNIAEARIVARLLAKTYREYGSMFRAETTVGVIVPYRNQIAMIRREAEAYGMPQLADVCIDTVERYQGSQRDVIIYSTTVRHLSQLDFLTANSFEEDGQIIDRKLNVAITRARKQLYIVGNEHILRHDGLYASLIDSGSKE